MKLRISVVLTLALALLLSGQTALASYGKLDYGEGVTYEGVLDAQGTPDAFGHFALPAGDYYGALAKGGAYLGPCAFLYKDFAQATGAEQRVIDFGANLNSLRIGTWYEYFGDGSWQEVTYLEGGIVAETIKTNADGTVIACVYENGAVVSTTDVTADAPDRVPMRLRVEERQEGMHYSFSSEDGAQVGCAILLYAPDGGFRLSTRAEWSVAYRYDAAESGE